MTTQQPISSLRCNHFGSYALQGHQVVSTEGHEHHNVYLCPKCGQFKIVGAQNGEHYSITFELVRDEHLEAAGQYIKYLERCEQERDAGRALTDGFLEDVEGNERGKNE